LKFQNIKLSIFGSNFFDDVGWALPTETRAIDHRLPIVFNRKPKYCQYKRDTWNFLLVGDAHPTTFFDMQQMYSTNNPPAPFIKGDFFDATFIKGEFLESPLEKGDFVVSSVERFRGLCFLLKLLYPAFNISSNI
jgi:hypothetical protein